MIYKMISCRTFIRLLLVLLLIGTLVTFAVLALTVSITSNTALSLYGVFILSYLVLEGSFAILNRRKVNHIRSGNLKTEFTDKQQHVVNCIIPGYNEDPDYYKACLTSYKQIVETEDIRIKHAIFLIDGLDSDNQNYMKEIFKDVFQEDGQLFVLDKTLRQLRPGEGHAPIMDMEAPIIMNKKYVCIMQPHAGKRDALYTGFILSINDTEVTAVVTSDSDSVMDKDSVIELTKMLLDKRVGSATGYVDIFNDETIVSYMSRLRYFFASHLERAYESFTGNVLCMSGPLSIYRITVLSQFLESWIDQKFLNKPCTYGDDRHLTNKILENGHATLFTQHAKCITETPTTWTRFLKQQLRWNKSSVREMGWTMKFISNRSIWMTVDVAYQTLYSLFIFGSIIYMVWMGSISNLITYCYGLIIISFIRSLFGVYITGNPKFLLYSLYSIIYLGFMIPLRIFSLCRLTDTTWGTTGRKLINAGLEEWFSVVMWWMIVIGGFIRKFYTSYETITHMQMYLLIGVLCYFVFLATCVWLLAKVNLRRQNRPLDTYLTSHCITAV